MQSEKITRDLCPLKSRVWIIHGHKGDNFCHKADNCWQVAEGKQQTALDHEGGDIFNVKTFDHKYKLIQKKGSSLWRLAYHAKQYVACPSLPDKAIDESWEPELFKGHVNGPGGGMMNTRNEIVPFEEAYPFGPGGMRKKRRKLSRSR